jgi:hypothetical protein
MNDFNAGKDYSYSYLYFIYGLYNLCTMYYYVDLFTAITFVVHHLYTSHRSPRGKPISLTKFFYGTKAHPPHSLYESLANAVLTGFLTENTFPDAYGQMTAEEKVACKVNYLKS